VIVPVHNRRERMLRCLEAVLAQDYASFEVLVLDNGSSDGTLEACRERAASARVPVRVESVGGRVGHVRNVGATLAAGDILAFTDSDCLPAPHWLRAGVNRFADPGVGIVTGTTLPEDPPPYRAWHATQEITEQTWRFETCNAFFRREALLASPGFDEQVTMWEDTAAGWGVMRLGWRAEFEPQALVLHDVRYPGWHWHLRRVMRYGEGAAIVRRFPEIERKLLYHKYFFRKRNAKFVAAIVGVALAPLSRKTLVLAAPYAWMRRPVGPTPGAVRESIRGTVFDGAILVGMIKGSIAARRLLL
jgi:glycosyltransferase involved in cell wall biosynthesis